MAQYFWVAIEESTFNASHGVEYTMPLPKCKNRPETLVHILNMFNIKFNL